MRSVSVWTHKRRWSGSGIRFPTPRSLSFLLSPEGEECLTREACDRAPSREAYSGTSACRPGSMKMRSRMIYNREDFSGVLGLAESSIDISSLMRYKTRRERIRFVGGPGIDREIHCGLYRRAQRNPLRHLSVDEMRKSRTRRHRLSNGYAKAGLRGNTLSG